MAASHDTFYCRAWDVIHLNVIRSATNGGDGGDEHDVLFFNQMHNVETVIAYKCKLNRYIISRSYLKFKRFIRSHIATSYQIKSTLCYESEK